MSATHCYTVEWGKYTANLKPVNISRHPQHPWLEMASSVPAHVHLLLPFPICPPLSVVLQHQNLVNERTSRLWAKARKANRHIDIVNTQHKIFIYGACYYKLIFPKLFANKLSHNVKCHSVRFQIGCFKLFIPPHCHMQKFESRF